MQSVTLVDDCWLQVFRWLPGEHVAGRIGLVCKHWHALSQDDLLWKALYDRDYCSVPVAEILQVYQGANVVPTDDRFWRLAYRVRAPDCRNADRLLAEGNKLCQQGKKVCALAALQLAGGHRTWVQGRPGGRRGRDRTTCGCLCG